MSKYLNLRINIFSGEIESDNDDDEELELNRSEDSVEEDSDKIYFLKAQRAEIFKGKIFLFFLCGVCFFFPFFSFLFLFFNKLISELL